MASWGFSCIPNILFLIFIVWEQPNLLSIITLANKALLCLLTSSKWPGGSLSFQFRAIMVLSLGGIVPPSRGLNCVSPNLCPSQNLRLWPYLEMKLLWMSIKCLVSL